MNQHRKSPNPYQRIAPVVRWLLVLSILTTSFLTAVPVQAASAGVQPQVVAKPTEQEQNIAASAVVASTAADPDGDGLNNGLEKQYMTDPTNPDSDGDGFADGPETFAWLTQPCDPASVPDTTNAAQLLVSPRTGSLRFEAVAGEPINDVQRVRNRGYGEMNWQASASAPWIKLAPANGGPLHWWMDHNTVEVRVDTTGLTPGY